MSKFDIIEQILDVDAGISFCKNQVKMIPVGDPLWRLWYEIMKEWSRLSDERDLLVSQLRGHKAHKLYVRDIKPVHVPWYNRSKFQWMSTGPLDFGNEKIRHLNGWLY